MTEISSNNKRIAKNTLMLYCRTLVILIVSLYTSRIVLNALGVEDYGIYNVVGGIVGMFSAFSGSLSFAISRYLTFELGKGDNKRLNEVFSTSINILLGLSLLVIIIGEVGGLWFIHNKLVIPATRVNAADWVLQASLFAFCVNLLSVPYNALIVAHERMSAFAYISLLEAVLKLIVCYCIIFMPYDKLIVYSMLTAFVALIIRLIYGIYCKRHFEECKYRLVRDSQLVKGMGSFTGWSFLTHSIFVLNTQGVNILMNLFFGVTLNAARGIAVQVQNVITQFVLNFTSALNPQIIKNYAQGNKMEMFLLVCRGAKFGFFLLLILSLPILFETEYILKLWLGVVPEHTANFVRLTIIGAMIDRMGDTGSSAIRAMGNVKKYSLTLSCLTCLIFPLSWVSFKAGFPPESSYVCFILIYICVQYKRLVLLKDLIGFPISMFVKEVIMKAAFCTAISILIPFLFVEFLTPSFVRFLLTIAISFGWTFICIYKIGLSKHEAIAIKGEILSKIKKYVFFDSTTR